MIKSTCPDLAVIFTAFPKLFLGLKHRLKLKRAIIAPPVFGKEIQAPGGDDCLRYRGYVSSKSNPIGLRANFYEDEKHGGAACRWKSSENFESYPTIIHGGVAYSLMDELLGHAVYAQCNTFGVTMRTTTHYHRPLKSGLEVTGRATVTRRFNRFLTVKGYLFNEQNRVTMAMSATFYIPTKSQFKRVMGDAQLPKETIPFCGIDGAF